MAGADGEWFTNLDSVLMQPFILNVTGGGYTNSNRIFINAQNKVDVPYDKPEWKAGLAYMHKLYAEGLIDPESFTRKGPQLKQVGENPNDVILGSAPSFWPGALVQVGGESGRYLQYYIVPALAGPDGKRYVPNTQQSSVTHGAFIISNACEIPAIAFRWVDGFYDPPFGLRANYGPRGVDWVFVDKETGETLPDISFDEALEKGVHHKLTKAWGETVTNSWRGNCLYNTPARFRDNELSWDYDPETVSQDIRTIWWKQQRPNTVYPYQVPAERMLPSSLIFDEQESAELTDLLKTINEYVGEMIIRFITGDADLDKDWDSYLNELDRMRLDRILEIYQNKYDKLK